jgi:hypothetical protein
MTTAMRVATPIRKSDTAPLSAVQRNIWFFQQNEKDVDDLQP